MKQLPKTTFSPSKPVRSQPPSSRWQCCALRFRPTNTPCWCPQRQREQPQEKQQQQQPQEMKQQLFQKQLPCPKKLRQKHDCLQWDAQKTAWQRPKMHRSCRPADSPAQTWRRYGQKRARKQRSRAATSHPICSRRARRQRTLLHTTGRESAHEDQSPAKLRSPF